MPILRGSSRPFYIQFLVEEHFASSFSLPFALAPDANPFRVARLQAAKHVWRGTCGFCVTCKTRLIFWVLLQESISSERMLFKQCALLCQKNILRTKLTSSFWATLTWPEVLQSVWLVLLLLILFLRAHSCDLWLNMVGFQVSDAAFTSRSPVLERLR